ncbi:hypothetical protein DY000_02015896 [Brassica cretica]|uniref:Retrotransposon gag domain-containing protein n=1 Tax=Brassica cretica TaxID=69181 RepID=A0ABQ7CTR6_BRACR|nr:hypothetical protein DY000_02015896 [Brassica cretica]
MPPVRGQSASYSRCYACFTENGQFASREEVVEEMKDCRSTVHPCHRSTVMPERGPNIFQDRLKPRSHTKLGEKGGTPLESSWNSFEVQPQANLGEEDQPRLSSPLARCGALLVPSRPVSIFIRHNQLIRRVVELTIVTDQDLVHSQMQPRQAQRDGAYLPILISSSSDYSPPSTLAPVSTPRFEATPRALALRLTRLKGHIIIHRSCISYAHIPPARAAPIPAEQPEPGSTYLYIVALLELMAEMGGTDPFEADVWLHDLEQNFAGTRFLIELKKDMAVYYLEKDSISWWLYVERNFGDFDLSWADFCTAFVQKYFPPEARDRLEIKFMELVQG